MDKEIKVRIFSIITLCLSGVIAYLTGNVSNFGFKFWLIIVSGTFFLVSVIFFIASFED